MAGKLGSNTIIKIGIVTDNIDETAAAFGRLFNVKQPQVMQPGTGADARPEAFRRYRGREVKNIPLKWALVELEPVYFELLQPADDSESPWRTHLERFGTSVCFVSFYIEGFSQHVDMMKNQGYELDFFEEKGFERYGYFDTLRTLGVTIECKERIPLEELPEGERL